ncbi:hypothetical protein L1987_68841 [Smallanthus sonchifolius]|uniref:Uncharacterized protein n=1 Tax=Smallanthus sonchifolius TaxID=185202 RepID=A0ACB9B654_9ASTR|nr:hypothetical protein L1987_68841 [Smallanthus sonchifolius]
MWSETKYLDLDSSLGQLETWRLNHWDAKKGWISADVATTYEDMMKLRNQHSVESMSDKSILEKVLGRSSVHLNWWGRDLVIASNTMGTTQKSKCPTYDKVVNELETLKAKWASMEEILIEKNIMPPPPKTSGTSQGDTLESDENIDE